MKTSVKIVITVLVILAIVFVFYFFTSSKPEATPVEVIVEQPVAVEEATPEGGVIAVVVDEDGNATVDGADAETAAAIAKGLAGKAIDSTIKSSVMTVKPTEEVAPAPQLPEPDVTE